MKNLHGCTLCGQEMEIGRTFAYLVKCTRKGCPEKIYDFVAVSEDETKRNWNQRFTPGSYNV